MIRQEIVVCEKCGALKELGDQCECAEEEKQEEDWKHFSINPRPQ